MSSSTGTWPSFARGITAENPKYLKCETIYSIKEENGFTFFQIDNDKALAEIISCGGHNQKMAILEYCFRRLLLYEIIRLRYKDKRNSQMERNPSLKLSVFSLLHENKNLFELEEHTI